MHNNNIKLIQNFIDSKFELWITGDNNKIIGIKHDKVMIFNYEQLVVSYLFHKGIHV